MKYEPLLFFSAIYNSQNNVSDFAEYDAQINNPFMGTYHFTNLEKGFEKIQTIWYDFYTKNYYDSNFLFDRVNDIIDNDTYIDLCYLFGGTLLIWVINPSKSYLLKTNNVIQNSLAIDLNQNDDWFIKKEKMQLQFDLDRKQIEKQIELMNAYTKRLIYQYNYRYLPLFEHWDEADEKWLKYTEEEQKTKPELDYIEEALYDGTHDKLHDGGLLNYHEAGKPKKLAVKWHIKKSEYTAYLWFEDDEICTVFDKFYGIHPDTKTDFIIHIDSVENKYELALYRYGLKEPLIIPEEAYQLIVFKNKFEEFRSDNYDQPRGAWIW